MTIHLSTEETLHNFLDRRERELARQISDLRSQLVPKETEFAEIRRTKASLGIAPVTTLSEVAGEFGEVGRRVLENAVRQIPPKDMTIKDLIVRALLDHFHSGASPAELGEYIGKQYGREIDPGSIRPNLARLRNDGLVIHDGLASRWILDPSAAGALLLNYASDADRAFLKRVEKLAWTAEDDAICKQYEELERGGMSKEDLKKWMDQKVDEKLARTE